MKYIAVVASVNDTDVCEKVSSFSSAMKRYNLFDTEDKAIVKIYFTMDEDTLLGKYEVHFILGNKNYIESLGVDFNDKTFGIVEEYLI